MECWKLKSSWCRSQQPSMSSPALRGDLQQQRPLAPRFSGMWQVHESSEVLQEQQPWTSLGAQSNESFALWMQSLNFQGCFFGSLIAPKFLQEAVACVTQLSRTLDSSLSLAVLKLNSNRKVISDSGYQFESEKSLPKYAFRAGTAHILLKSFVSI